MKKQNSSLSLHNFLNENIPNLVNLRENMKNEVIKVNIGVKRHCGDRNLKTKTAVSVNSTTNSPTAMLSYTKLKRVLAF